MRLLVTGGGTGGHVYPGLSILEAFGTRPELLWVCRRGGMEEALLQREHIPYKAIAAGGLTGMSWGTRLQHSLKLINGFGAAFTILRQFRPNVVLSTGGYVTFPVGLAAWLQRIPIVIYLPDIKPGVAVRALAPFAKKVAITTPDTRSWFGDKSVVVGYPVRHALAQPKTKSEARRVFGLPKDANVLLVTGGSLGAHRLNEAIGSSLKEMVEVAHVIHIHGKNDGAWLAEQQTKLPEELQSKYQPFEYLHDTMPDALIAADVVVARAGASVLGEFSVVGLPAVLVPLPIAGVQQSDNARWLQQRGGAVVVEDEKAITDVPKIVRDLFAHPVTLDEMRTAMRQMARPDAATKIVALLQEVAKQ